jgi:hypothetical protein
VAQGAARLGLRGEALKVVIEFKLDDHGFCWAARVSFISWDGYSDHCYSNPAQLGPKADDSVELIFAPEGRDASPLTDSELALVDWFLTNEPDVSAAAKAAIFSEYPNLLESYGYSDEERADFMPDLAGLDDLKRLIELYSVNVHQIEKDGIPYVGLEFGCSWDREHGLGVLTHGTRVVEIGGADSAILLWIAQDDAEAEGGQSL